MERRRPPTAKTAARLGLLATGLGAGLWLALPVRLAPGVTGCPAAGEGRGMCLLQAAYVPAVTKVALCLAVAWLLSDWLLVRRGARPSGAARRRPVGSEARERAALLADPGLRAAAWGAVPAAASGPRLVILDRLLRPTRRRPVSVAAVTRGGAPEVRALHPRELPAADAVYVLSGARADGERLDRNDPALVAACWSVVARGTARLVDRAAAQLGLADEAIAAPAAADRPEPDPLLAAALWQAPVAEQDPAHATPMQGRAARVAEARREAGLDTPRRPRISTLLLPRGGRDRVVTLAFVAAGLVVGALLALPAPDAAVACPPQGEGYGLCALQESWLPTAIALLGPVVVARVLAWALLGPVRTWRTRVARGERPVRETRAQAAVDLDADPLLRAASWAAPRDRAAA